MKVYKAIAAVMGDLAKTGVAKTDVNTHDNYKFRGIDAVYNALAPLLSKHGLIVLPRVLERTSEERTSRNGGAVFYITVKAEFDFVAAEDGSKHTVCAYGEGMDRGDKGTNKAMTAAYKYAMFEAFCIPTEGSDDADAETHEVKPAPKSRPGTPTDGAWDGISPEDKEAIEACAATVQEYMEAEDVAGAVSHIDRQGYSSEHKIALWTLLPSKTRTAIKKAKEAK